MDIKKDFALYLYNRLPKIYRTSDKDLILQKLIETFTEGGFNHVINDTSNIMDLIDVDKCPKKFLPLLSKTYGYEYSEELPELFQRRLLKNIVEMYKRKGTKSVVKFIARELSGFETEIIENKDFSENDIDITGWTKEFKNYRNFILKLKAPYETSMLQSKEDAVKLVLTDFLPTNSNVFIITSYWFEESDNFTNSRVAEGVVKETIKEYNEEVLSVLKFLETNMTNKMKLNETSEEYFFINTPLAYQDIIPMALNDTSSSTLNKAFITNNVYLLDLVKDFSSETVTLSITDSNKEEIIDQTTNNFAINSISELNNYGILLLENKYQYAESVSEVFYNTIHYKSETEIKEAIREFTYTQTNATKWVEDNLNYLGSNISINLSNVVKEDCKEEKLESYAILGDNSVLNRPSCVLGSFLTNALFSYDVVKTEGQEDLLIIL